MAAKKSAKKSVKEGVKEGVREGAKKSVKKSAKERMPRPESRAERFLLDAVRTNAVARPQKDGTCFVLPGQRRKLPRAGAADLVSRGLAAWRDDGALVPTEEAHAWAKRQTSERAHRAQHGDLVQADPTGPATDLAESPLLWLYRRKDGQGQRLIGEAMFAAGERLRADFTFGNMTPRVTLNWSAPVEASRKPDGGEPSENALAARQRVRRALERVGPELSGILIDVCCFLKRLEDVERDRGWPARSAKVILSLALSRLARHYGYSDAAEGRLTRRA